MKKILYTMMGVGMLFAATSCEDFLDTSSQDVAANSIPTPIIVDRKSVV